MVVGAYARSSWLALQLRNPQAKAVSTCQAESAPTSSSSEKRSDRKSVYLTSAGDTMFEVIEF